MNSTMYNKKLKRAYIRVNYVSKREIQESECKAEEVAQTRGWLLLRDLIPPQMLLHAHNSGSKRTQLEPDTAEGKVQGAGS